MMYGLGPYVDLRQKARLPQLENYFRGSPPLYAPFTVLQLCDFLKVGRPFCSFIQTEQFIENLESIRRVVRIVRLIFYFS